MNNSSSVPRPRPQFLKVHHPFARSQSGAETVEVALTIGFFLILILMFVEMALYLYSYLAVGDVAREAVRYAVVRGNLAALDDSRGDDAPATRERIEDFVIDRGTVNSPVTVSACWPSNQYNPLDPNASCSGNSPALGDGVNNLPGMKVIITVTHTHQFLFLPQQVEAGRTISTTAQGTILY